jgi:hypothetical protein
MSEPTDPRYDQLPETIKRIYSQPEWVWLTDEQKQNLQAQETEPEWDE